MDEARYDRIVKLRDPLMCLGGCRFCRTATVETDSGARRMLHCARLDCDNWDTSEPQEKVKSFRVDAA